LITRTAILAHSATMCEHNYADSGIKRADSATQAITSSVCLRYSYSGQYFNYIERRAGLSAIAEPLVSTRNLALVDSCIVRSRKVVQL